MTCVLSRRCGYCCHARRSFHGLVTLFYDKSISIGSDPQVMIGMKPCRKRNLVGANNEHFLCYPVQLSQSDMGVGNCWQMLEYMRNKRRSEKLVVIGDCANISCFGVAVSLHVGIDVDGYIPARVKEPASFGCSYYKQRLSELVGAISCLPKGSLPLSNLSKAHQALNTSHGQQDLLGLVHRLSPSMYAQCK